MDTLANYVSSGAKLMDMALRDDAPIVSMMTFWDFMKVVEDFGRLFTSADRFDQVWHEHVRCYEGIMMSSHDTMPVGEDMVALGSTFIATLAAYAEQSASFLGFIVLRRDRESIASLLQRFDAVLSRLLAEIEEIPHATTLDVAVKEYQRCHREDMHDQQ